jgi:hypothetical protein
MEGRTDGRKGQLVDNANQAKYKVFIVDHGYRQKNDQLIKGGKLVQSGEDVTVFLVAQEYQADIVISRANFPTP